MKWIEFAESFIADSKACFDVLSKFNEELTPKAVLLGNGLRPSEADVVVFSTVHSSVVCISSSCTNILFLIGPSYFHLLLEFLFRQQL